MVSAFVVGLAPRVRSLTDPTTVILGVSYGKRMVYLPFVYGCCVEG